MIIRISLDSRGSLSNYTWERFYRLEVKTFMFWHTLGKFETIDLALREMEKFGKPSKIIYRY